MTRRRAFTLIEMLVVVAIIITLLAILMPSMQRAVRAAQIAQCHSNLRQIALGHVAYASDEFGKLPFIGEYWQHQQMGYGFYWVHTMSQYPQGGFQNLGLIASGGYLPVHSDVWFCPFKPEQNPQGDPGHYNATPGGVYNGSLRPGDERYGWVFNRSGYFRRIFGTESGPLDGKRLRDVAGRAYLSDSFATPKQVEERHATSLAVAMGDGSVAEHDVDYTRDPWAALPATHVGGSGTISLFNVVWDSFE